MRGGNGARVLSWLVMWLLLGGIVLLTGSGAALALWAGLTLLPLLGLALALPVRRRLKLRLRFPVLGTRNMPLEGVLEAENPTRFPVGQLVCRVKLENRLTGETERVLIRLHPGTRGSVQVPLHVQSRYCGYIKLELERVLVTDLTGMIPLPAPVQAEARLTALPELLPVNLDLTYPAVTPDDGEAWLEGRKGSDHTQTLQLREYVPGDSIRQIHWKLSSKLDCTIVREPSFPVSRSLLIFWDKTAAPAEAARMNAMAEAIFAVCRAVSEQGFAYHLAWNDGQSVCAEEIQTEDALLQTLPRMLKSGSRDADGTALGFLPDVGQEQYSKILYFTAACPNPSLLEAFAQGGELTIFLCAAQAPATAYRTICYTPETCLQMLQSLELEA